LGLQRITLNPIHVQTKFNKVALIWRTLKPIHVATNLHTIWLYFCSSKKTTFYKEIIKKEIIFLFGLQRKPLKRQTTFLKSNLKEK
jgi:hypothetical protein